MYVKTKFQKPYERNAIILSRIKEDIPFYEIAAEFGMSVSELSDFAEAEAENEKLKHSLKLKKVNYSTASTRQKL